MYWSKGGSDGSLSRAVMDGSELVVLVPRINEPRGVQIDFQESRLYWASAGDKTIESSDFDGQNRLVVARLPQDSWPQGLAILGDSIFWSDHYSGKLEQSFKSGPEINTLVKNEHDIKHLTLVPDPGLPNGVGNLCAHRNCSIVCVLTSSSSWRCLP